MKTVYIAHPFLGKQENVDSVEKIILQLLKINPKILYISPLHATGFYYFVMSYEDDQDNELRAALPIYKMLLKRNEIALEALREKAERENQKPCEYCQTGIKTISMKFNKPQTEYGKPWWTESVRDPKFCPMCGRKLEPKEAR